jgi:hypothetical protein
LASAVMGIDDVVTDFKLWALGLKDIEIFDYVFSYLGDGVLLNRI